MIIVIQNPAYYYLLNYFMKYITPEFFKSLLDFVQKKIEKTIHSDGDRGIYYQYKLNYLDNQIIIIIRQHFASSTLLDTWLF